MSAISATDTTISVDNANLFPSSGTVVIDSEQIAYSDKFGNTLLNVQRGINQTTAAAHATGALVRFLSPTVPTPPRATPTEKPRGVIYRAIGQGSGCGLQSAPQVGAGPLLMVVGAAAWAVRRRRGR